MPISTTLQKILLLLLGVVLSLMLAEFILFAFHLAPQVSYVEHGRFRLSKSPKIGYEPVPDREYQEENASGYRYEGRSNRLGFRDRDHAVKKNPNAFRILVLGDSIAEGIAVIRSEQIFPRLLEENLQKGGIPAEVLNFGVAGYNTQQEIALFAEKGAEFKPDLVLLAYCTNDRERNDGGVLFSLLQQVQNGKQIRKSNLPDWLLASHLYRFTRFRVISPMRFKTNKELKQFFEPYRDLFEDRTEESFAHLAALQKAGGSETLVVVFPYFRNLEKYDMAAEHEFILNLSQKHHFLYLDLLDAFRACQKNTEQPLNLDNLHPSPLGHQCAASEIASFLLKAKKAP